MSVKLSIIVPVYKVEKYLRRCLDSIKSQTFSDFECILVDDGSPDSSGKICDEYAKKDTRFHVIHKANGGVSSARNAGLDAAKGEWIGFVDADDWIEKQTYEIAIKAAYEKNVDLVQWNSWTIDENGIKKPFYDAGVLQEGCFTAEDCCKYFHGSMCNKIVLRKLFCCNQIHFDEDIAQCEDRIVAFKCYVKAKTCYQLNDFLYNYFQRTDSAIHSLTKEKILQEKRGIEIMENYISEDKLKKLKKLFLQLKGNCRTETIFMLSPPDFSFYRKIFPESLRFLLFKFEKSTIVHWLVLLHFDFLAKTVISAWQKIRT